jgi:uncharacterized integral membrane protein (TIGR00698 family)
MAICSEVHPVAASGLACVVGNDGNRWTTVNREGVKLHRHLGHILPGILLCISVSAAAAILERLEVLAFGRAWLEPLVLAILIGAMTRTLWSPGARWLRGIKFSAKTLLEVAVLLLGCSLSAQTVIAVGPELLGGIAIVVLIAIGTSYGIGKLLGLPRRMATLVACGNSICGNSAIAAVAPVIGADGDDIAASIAFTAVLGVIVVVGLPFLPMLVHLSRQQYGVLAGLTVYAVPQVLAATTPLGSVAVQTGTLVKLMRVLMLGPVVLVLSLLARRWRYERDGAAPRGSGERAIGQLPLHAIVPWYILGFLVMAGLRSAGLLPHATLVPLATAARLLTVISMAALGLGTDLRTVSRAGVRVTASGAISLLLLGFISFGLIRLLRVA